MRFQLVCRSSNRLFQLYVGTTLVPVSYPSLRRQHENREVIVWTWLDGVEYAMLRPRWRDSCVSVVSGGKTVCSGRFFFGVGAFLLQAFRDSRVVVSEWEYNGQTIVWQGGSLCWKSVPTTFTLLQPDGVRLAFFCFERGRFVRLGVTYNGVMRDNLRDEVVPVLFGILLAGIHAPILLGS
jgi:hypothetical protein